ncbi:hypothetical protein MP228_008005 [Amoeboaphelidium protococcarum]|nr:hypothetical protein MP228_008005 [Amoeboaphelidium protococcarum]
MIVLIQCLVYLSVSIQAMDHERQTEPSKRFLPTRNRALDEMAFSTIADKIGRPEPRQTEGADRFIKRVKDYCQNLSHLQMASRQIRQSLSEHEEVKWCRQYKSKAVLYESLRPLLHLGFNERLVFDRQIVLGMEHFLNLELWEHIMRLLKDYHTETGQFEFDIIYSGMCFSQVDKIFQLIATLPFASINLDCIDNDAVVLTIGSDRAAIRASAQERQVVQLALNVLSEQLFTQLSIDEQNFRQTVFQENQQRIMRFKHVLLMDLTTSELRSGEIEFQLDDRVKTFLAGRTVELTIKITTKQTKTVMKSIAQFVNSLELGQYSLIRITLVESSDFGLLSRYEVRHLYDAFYHQRINLPLFISPIALSNIVRNTNQEYMRQQLLWTLFQASLKPGVFLSINSLEVCAVLASLLRNLPTLLLQYSRDFVYYRTGAKPIDFIYDLSIQVQARGLVDIEQCVFWHLLPALDSVPIKKVQLFINGVISGQSLTQNIQQLFLIDPQKTKIEIFQRYLGNRYLLQDFIFLSANYDTTGVF